MTTSAHYDAIVVGGGPAGATAAHEIAQQGYHVALLERDSRIKPCGGAIPPRLLEDFDVPNHLMCTRVNSACIVSPSDRRVRMPIDNGFVGMVDREVFDPWLRDRAGNAGVEVITTEFRSLSERPSGGVDIEVRDNPGEASRVLSARVVIGADGANSKVASQGIYGSSRHSLVDLKDEIVRFVPGDNPMQHVAAYHEIIETPSHLDGRACEVHYNSELSPDFYAWVFPHGEKTSVGVGSAQRGFSLRESVTTLRSRMGLTDAVTIRREGAPIPLHPKKRWDNGRNVIVVGDAAGVVAPASGEGIYYAMLSGRLAADAVGATLAQNNPALLKKARKRFMSEHAQTFRMLGMMQKYWYTADDRRERFVSICGDPDVQYLTWTAYMNKRLVRAKPVAHMRIFFKNIGHLTGLAATT